MYYRVRLSWDNPQSQLGAYEILQNAINKCDENPGYSVFDENGTVVHKSGDVVIKTMSYKAKLKKKVGNHAKGSKVTVTRDMKKQWVLPDGAIVPKKSDMDLLKQYYDNTCTYSKAAAEAWVNNNGFASSTGWLFWCNKWGQRVYIFKGSKGAWVLDRTYKCGTGNIANGDNADQGVGFSWKFYDKHKTYKNSRGTMYYVSHYSSPAGNAIHKGSTGKPSTHGCIALGKTAAIWVFDNIPVGTRVVVY